MDLGEILRVMRKRWYVMVPIMVLTAALTGVAYLAVPTTYESTSTISLLSAEQTSVIDKTGNTNPYLTFDSSLVATADFLCRSMSSKETRSELKDQGVTEEFTAALADNAQGPFVTITVVGNDSAKVMSSARILTEFAGRRLRQIQADSGVREVDMVRTTTIVPPQEPEAKVKDKLTIVIGIAGAGTAGAFIATFVLEGLALSRRKASPVVAATGSSVSLPPGGSGATEAGDRRPAPPVAGAAPAHRPPVASSPQDAEETRVLVARGHRPSAASSPEDAEETRVLVARGDDRGRGGDSEGGRSWPRPPASVYRSTPQSGPTDVRSSGTAAGRGGPDSGHNRS